jgi:hypothetical protein
MSLPPPPGGRGERKREFGPDAKPKKTFQKEKPRGPIRERGGGRHFSLDDLVDEGPEAAAPATDLDDFATSKPEDPKKEDQD